MSLVVSTGSKFGNFISAVDRILFDCTLTVISQDLCPLPTTVRGAAALSFYRVLKMEKRGRLATEQEETYGPIGIRDTESQQ